MFESFNSINVSYDSKNCILTWQPVKSYLEEQDWNDSFSFAFDYYFSLTREGYPVQWLNDCRFGDDLNPQLVNTLNKYNEILYKMDTDYQKKVAFVKSDSGVFNAAINTYYVDVLWNKERSFDIKLFNSLEQAKHWLLDPT